jgi:hypothetical protein
MKNRAVHTQISSGASEVEDSSLPPTSERKTMAALRAIRRFRLFVFLFFLFLKKVN